MSHAPNARAKVRMSAYDKLPPIVRRHLAIAKRDLDVRFLIEARNDSAATDAELLKMIEVKLERTA